MNPSLIQQAASTFLQLEQLLLTQQPQEIALAQRLQQSVVLGPDVPAQAAWDRLWEKPFYANTKVKIGTKNIQTLASLLPTARSWEVLLDQAQWSIEHIGKGTAPEAFKIEGSLALEARSRGLAAHRLYACTSAAKLFSQRLHSVSTQTPFSDLRHSSSLLDIVLTLQDELGEYWGPITILHFLTDIGLACKPDLHLVRTIRALGFPTGHNSTKIPDLAQCLRIIDHVRKLCTQLYPQDPVEHHLRYVDLVLMGASRFKLLEQLPNP